MKIRIDVVLEDDNGRCELQQRQYVNMIELTRLRYLHPRTIIGDVASDIARKFWDAVVMMGYTE